MARRRKTRTSSSDGSSAKKLRVYIIRAAIVIVALLLLGLLAWNQLLSYLQGESFRHKLEGILSEEAQATVTLKENLNISGGRVGLAQIDLRNHEQVQQLQAERVSMEVDRGALLDRNLHIEKVSMEEGTIIFRGMPEDEETTAADETTGKGGNLPTGPAADGQKGDTKTAAVQEEKGFFSLQDVLLDQLECKNTDLILPTEEDGKCYALQGTTMTARPLPGGKTNWRIDLENGHLTTPFNFLKATSLKHAHILYNKGSATLPECRFLLTPGELRVQGRYNGENKRWSAEMNVNKANVHRILRDDWKKKLTGELFGKMVFSGESGTLKKSGGNLSLQQGVLEGLPFLSELSFDGSYPYRSLELDKATCRISYPYNDAAHNLKNAWMFDQINVRSKGGNLRIVGHVIIGEDGALGGTLTVGIPQQRLAELTFIGSLTQQIFNAQGDAGYAWVNINLSGTLDDPQEDLSVRMTTLMTEWQRAAGQAVQQGIQAGLETAQSGMEAASGMFGNLVNQARQAAGLGGTESSSGEQTEQPKQDSSPITPGLNIIKTGLDLLF